MLCKNPDVALSGKCQAAFAGAPFLQAEGGQTMPCGDAVVQTQECTHVSEQLLAVEEGALPRQADWLRSICIYLDAL